MENNNGFINFISSGIDQFQKEAIEILLKNNRVANSNIDLEFIKSERDSLVARVRSNLIAFKPDFVGPGRRITAEFYNDMFESIFIDLSTLYRQIALFSSDFNIIKTISESNLISTKSSISTFINEARAIRFLKLNPEYQDVKYISFINALNRTKVRPAAEVDRKSRVLKLQPESVNRSALNFDLATVSGTTRHLGGGIASQENKEYGPDKALDNNPDSFSFETVLCDGVPSHKYLTSHYANRRLGSGIQEGNILTSRGIIFETIYTASKTVRCNQIRLFPIANFPVKLIDLCYKRIDSSEEWITVPGFNPDNFESTLDWIEWNGVQFHFTSIKIVFEQANATQHIFHIPENIAKNNNIWSQIIDNSFRSSIHSLELDQVLNARIAVEPESLTYLNELNDISNSVRNITLGKSSEIKVYDVNESLQKIFKDNINTFNPSNQIVEIKKLQYNFGLRQIEVNDVTYLPFGIYESQKFNSNANVVEIELETTEEHITQQDGITSKSFNTTSVEWEVELAPGIAYPIAPYNYLQNGYAEINDEVMILNKKDMAAITRFPVYTGMGTGNFSFLVRKNGIAINPVVPNSKLGGGAIEYNYSGSFVDNKIKVDFNSLYFDQRAVYTISYKATTDSTVLDLNQLLNSDTSPEPEVYINTNNNNSVQLNFYPYVEYSIINDDSNWSLVDNKYTFVPTLNNYAVGTVSITGSTLQVVTGASTLWNLRVKDLVTGNTNGLTGAAIHFIGDTRIYPIQTVVSNTELRTYDVIETGFITGNLTGLPYVIGKYTKIDGINYGLINTTYEPITVFVNDVKAINKTNYETLEQPAFTPGNENSRIYEYLQAGKNLYFNAPINGKIEVLYRHLTEYIKVNAILRSHKPINALTTPIVRDYTVRIKNSKI